MLKMSKKNHPIPHNNDSCCFPPQNYNNDNNDNQKTENNSKEETEAKDVWRFVDKQNVKDPDNPKLITIPAAPCGSCRKLGGKRNYFVFLILT